MHSLESRLRDVISSGSEPDSTEHIKLTRAEAEMLLAALKLVEAIRDLTRTAE